MSRCNDDPQYSCPVGNVNHHATMEIWLVWAKWHIFPILRAAVAEKAAGWVLVPAK